jgi:hypothetical protein
LLHHETDFSQDQSTAIAAEIWWLSPKKHTRGKRKEGFLPTINDAKSTRALIHATSTTPPHARWEVGCALRTAHCLRDHMIPIPSNGELSPESLQRPWFREIDSMFSS